jgi:hypothetical protein
MKRKMTFLARGWWCGVLVGVLVAREESWESAMEPRPTAHRSKRCRLVMRRGSAVMGRWVIRG